MVCSNMRSMRSLFSLQQAIAASAALCALAAAAAAAFAASMACFAALEAAGCEHESIVTGGSLASVTMEAFTWVNTMISNVKNSIHGTYYAVSDKHLPRYLAEFCYRFNRHFKLQAMLPRLGRAAVRTPPMPKRLLPLAEAH